MDKEEISRLLSSKLGENISVKELVLVGSGHHADGYKAVTDNGKSFFIKKIKVNDLGFEFPERKISALLVSHSMAKRNNLCPASIGVAIKKENMEFLPEIGEDTDFYHIQEYAGDGKSYLQMLKERKKKDIDDEDRREIDQIVEFIVNIHNTKHPSKDEERLKAVYNDYLASVIGHPEYLLQLLQKFSDDDSLLSPEKQGQFIALMLENMHRYKNRHDRLVALHGDFWPANAFFREDGTLFVIDYSRMPWGDAGFDVGFWISQYFLMYHAEKSEYFKKLGEYFLNKYLELTNDHEVKKTMVYGLGIISAIYASDRWVPEIDESTREKVFNIIQKMLKEKEFFWN